MLFDPKDISSQNAKEQVLEGSVVGNSPNSARISSKGSKLIHNLDNCLAAGHTLVHFISAGEISLHKLIEHLCSRHPGETAELWLSTWTIKEAAARTILQLKESNAIKDIKAVFDYRIKTTDSKTFHFLEKHFAQYALTKNHAKVIVLDFVSAQYTIVTSANLSNNPRIESGLISTDPLLAQFHITWMRDVLAGKKVY